MELTSEQIRKIRPQGSMVLIKLDRIPEEIKLESGKVIYIDPNYEPEKHAAVTGHVIATPPLIYSYSKLRRDSMPWDTDMELEIGDYVIFYYLAAVNAFRKEDPKWLKDENENFYVFVKYENFYVAKRKMGNIDDYNFMAEAKVADPVFSSLNPGKTKIAITGGEVYPVDEKGDYHKIIPLNGYCIIEPVINEEYQKLEKKYKELELDVPKQLMKKFSAKYGIVKYLGKPNRAYRTPGSDGGDIKVGDRVILRRIANITLEYEYHATFDGRKKYFRVQRRYIMAVA